MNVSQLAAMAISFRIPEFRTRLWFAQVESILASQKQGDETKYNLVIAKRKTKVIICSVE